MTRLLSPLLLLTAAIALTNLAAPCPSWANDLVMGRYLRSEGKEIQLELDVQPPTPASVIVVQYLPKGIGIMSSSPKPMKFNQKKGVAKWLLKGVEPGKRLVTMQLDRPLRSGEVSGEVRYKHPATGKMIVIRFQ